MRKSANVSYEQYVRALYVQPNSVTAWSFPPALMSFIRDAKAVLAEVVKLTGQSLDVLLQAFRSKELFQIFKAVGFSLKKLLQAIRATTSLIPLGLMKVFEALKDTAVVKALKSGALKVDDFLDQHPVLRKLIGPAMAGLLFWMWMNSAFVGGFDFDMDMSYILSAFAGRFSVEDLFTSTEGLAALAALALGFSGLSLAWLGNDAANLILACLFTGAKQLKDTSLVTTLRKLLPVTRIHSSRRVTSVRQIATTPAPAQTAAVKLDASGLNAVRASELFRMLGIKNTTLQDSSEGMLIFSVHDFHAAVGPLTKFYGAAKNESNAGWQTKRLVWSVPEVSGQVMLMQVANQTPLLLFKQL